MTECPSIPYEILVPRYAWEDRVDYDRTAIKLAGLFSENFAQYADGVRDDVKSAGPNI